METPGLNHIIMTIKDVNISRAFYGDLLGFELEKIADGFFLVVGGVTIFFFPSSQLRSRLRGFDHLGTWLAHGSSSR